MNRETMFTKGDWEIVWDNHEAYDMIISKETDETVCTNVEEKNAHLIIAAPELYAELEFIRSYIQGNRAIEFKNRIDNLLSKARGEK